MSSETIKKQSNNYEFLNVIDTPGLSDYKGKEQENTKKWLNFYLRCFIHKK